MYMPVVDVQDKRPYHHPALDFGGTGRDSMHDDHCSQKSKYPFNPEGDGTFVMER